MLHNDSWPSILQFHAFEPHLAVADEADNIWWVLPSQL